MDHCPGERGGAYTVHAGDTLRSVAAAVYGDSQLWYLIAGANGLAGEAGLAEGATIILPAGVTRNTNRADTFQPFNPADAIGDTSPAIPQPGRGNQCGILGRILQTIIAVAVTVVTAGQAAPYIGPVLAGALGGATGSIVSQGLGVATGIQDKFSFKDVGLATIAGGVGGALKGATLFSKIGDKFGSFASGAARGATSSALTQGIGVATGLQSKFSFAGVAAAGVGGGLSNSFSNSALGDGVSAAFGGGDAGRFASDLASNTAGGLANAATRSALNGSSFGDNFRAAIPDIIGQAVGNAVAGGIGEALRDPGKEATEVANARSKYLGEFLDQAVPDTQFDISGSFIAAQASATRRLLNSFDKHANAAQIQFSGKVANALRIRDADVQADLGFRADGLLRTLDVTSVAFDRLDQARAQSDAGFASFLRASEEGFQRGVRNVEEIFGPDLIGVNTATGQRIFSGVDYIPGGTGTLVIVDPDGTSQLGSFNGRLAALQRSIVTPDDPDGLASVALVGSSLLLAADLAIGGAARPLSLLGGGAARLSRAGAILQSTNRRDVGRTATVFRVDTLGFPQRVRVGHNGSVEIPIILTRAGGERALFIGVNTPQRASEFLTANRSGRASISTFEIERKFLTSLRRDSALEGVAKNGILRVDISKARDQFGLRSSSQIQQLREAVIEGSGKIVK